MNANRESTLRIHRYWRALPFMAFALLAGCSAADGADVAAGAASATEADEETDTAAQALGTCTGNACNGLDPSATGCNADAETRASADLYAAGSIIGKVAIRYSPSCQTAWTRVSTSTPYFLRAEVMRASPAFSGAAASPYATTAQLSPMGGVGPGTRLTGTGRAGFANGNYLYVASVSTLF